MNQRVPSPFKNILDTSIKLIFLALIVAWCLILIFPFGSIITWSIILAMAVAPLYTSLTTKLGGREKLSATIIVVGGILIILVPSFLFIESVIEGIRVVKYQFENDLLTIPPPTSDVKEWPLVGEQLYTFWASSSENLQATIVQYKGQLADFGKFFLEGLLSVGGSIFQFIAATIISGALLVTSGKKQVTKKFFSKLVGDQADEVTDLAQRTVNNVVKGVLGVAFIQSFLVGIGFLLAGVPYAGLWALLVLLLAILQLPAILIILPIAIYLFTIMGTVPAILWTIYLIVAGLSDNFLKPILLGKGAPVPMLVIFLGVIGGFITMGFIGLFIGAIVLSLGYRLFIGWLNEEESTRQSTSGLD